MKKFLKRWLEIPEESEGPDMSRYVKKDDIREVVEDAIYEAFQPKSAIFWGRPAHVDIHGILRRRVKEVIKDDVRCAFDERIKTCIEPERFIDEIVERIRNKQLIQ